MTRKDKLALMGKRVLVTRCFQRVSDYGDSNRGRGTRRFWKASYPISAEGWLVGFRWLQDGYTSYGTGDEPNHWVESGPRTQCAMVALTPDANPIRVPMDSFEEIKA